MAYIHAKKLKGVGYFQHFPKNFLKPYGRAESFQADAIALSRLCPEGCEWLRRPHVATSELCSTITENIPLLQEDSLLLGKNKIRSFISNIQPLALTLENFHKDSLTSPSDLDKRSLLFNLLNIAPDLAFQLNSCIEIGAAHFSIGLNIRVAHLLISNPEKYADLLTYAPNPEPPFKSSKNILDLLPLLHYKKTTLPGSSTDIAQLTSLLRSQTTQQASATSAHK